MDKQSLDYMAKKVNAGRVLSKRIDILEAFKEKLTKEKGYLTISVLINGYSKNLNEEATREYIFEKYKGFVLDGINAELEELRKEFEEL